MYDDDVVSASGSDMEIQPNSEVPVVDNNRATKKARQEDNKKKKEAKIAAVNKMAETIFGHPAAECMKCKTLTQELCGIKDEMEKREKQLKDMERDVKLKEQQLSESQERIGDLQSSLKAKKRVIDNLEKELAEPAKKVKSGELDYLHMTFLALCFFHVDLPSISVSSIRFLEDLVSYYKSSPNDVNSDESSDEVYCLVS